METTDEVRRAEEYIRDRTFKMFSMGKARPRLTVRSRQQILP
jgi:hypothetical protein